MTEKVVSKGEKTNGLLWSAVIIEGIIIALMLQPQIRDYMFWALGAGITLVILYFIFKKGELELHQLAERIKKEEMNKDPSFILDNTMSNILGQKIGEEYHIFFRDRGLLYTTTLKGEIIGKEYKSLDEKRDEIERSDIAKSGILADKGKKLADEELKRLGLEKEEAQ